MKEKGRTRGKMNIGEELVAQEREREREGRLGLGFKKVNRN